ncbi:MAG: DUF2304 domain-containing protein [Candidatus Bathyarchaeota archaeon]|nr:MAG: DUF2304 domain-containing protein [Candidatus Bathyarchaeota archaeon]
MLGNYSVIGLFFALFILALDFYLLRKRKIEGKGFVFWFITGVVLALFSGVPALFSLFLLLFGTELLISAVVATGFFFFLIAFFYIHYRISELKSQLMKLTMEISVSKYGQQQQGAGNPAHGSPRKKERKVDRKR